MKMIGKNSFDSDKSYENYMALQSQIDESQKKIEDLKPWIIGRIVETLLDKIFSSDDK